MEKFTQFIQNKYPDVPGSRSTSRAFEIDRIDASEEGQVLKDSQEQRIESYFSRLKNITDNERGFSLLKQKIFTKYLTIYTEIPESYYENIMRDTGHLALWRDATEKQKEQIRRENSEVVLEDQKASLEEWLDYFSSEDSAYIPDEIKYWVFRSVLQLGEYDKDKNEFGKRSTGSVKKFPDLHQEGLSYVIDAVIQKYEGKEKVFEYDISQEERIKFNTFLQKENFAKMYGWTFEHYAPIAEHLLPITEGEWKKYVRGTDHGELVRSIKGKGTGWCTAGENTAKSQLAQGDFYVFYSHNDDGQAVVPRIAIRMQQQKIQEVRGIAFKQNLDPYMADVLNKKLTEFPDKEIFLKKDAHNKLLTSIDKKTKKNEPLTQEETRFIYEVDGKIEGFGYDKDPRIAEILGVRNPKEDLSIIFNCAPSQIVTNLSEVSPDTKAYIGPWSVAAHHALPAAVEHIYSKTLENKVFRRTIELSTRTNEEYLEALDAQGMQIDDWTKANILPTLKPLEKKESVNLVSFSVANLGFPDGATLAQIYAKAQELELGLCDPHVGPEMRLAFKDQPLNSYYRVAMEPVIDADGYPRVWYVRRNGGGLWLDNGHGYPDVVWHGGNVFVFSSRA